MPSAGKPKRKIRVVVDLTGGVVQEVVHDARDVQLDLVFVTSDRDDLGDENPVDHVQVRSAYYEGNYVYTIKQSMAPPVPGSVLTRMDIIDAHLAGEEYRERRR